MTDQFKSEIIEGLSKAQKTLPSKYFYDAKGDKLFQQIMAMPEYYLTRAEFDIFTNQAAEIVHSFEIETKKNLEIIELGAGDGTKTFKLLQECIRLSDQFQYKPIDISTHALQGLVAMLHQKLPHLTVAPQQGTYFDVLQGLSKSASPKIVLFLGSNLGNLEDAAAARFMRNLADCLSIGDKVLLGLDLIKPKHIVLPAYNDEQGITREFNLNLLDRINRELGGNFNRAQFEHAPEYDQNEGIAKSYIRSKTDQTVSLAGCEKTFFFKSGERIHTEISRKYNDDIISKIIAGTNLNIQAKFVDSNHYFADYLLSKH